MNKKYRQFKEAFKLQVIEEVLSGQLSKEQARRKYNIKGTSAILNWMRSFGVAEHKRVQVLQLVLATTYMRHIKIFLVIQKCKIHVKRVTKSDRI